MSKRKIVFGMYCSKDRIRMFHSIWLHTNFHSAASAFSPYPSLSLFPKRTAFLRPVSLSTTHFYHLITRTDKENYIFNILQAFAYILSAWNAWHNIKVKIVGWLCRRPSLLAMKTGSQINSCPHILVFMALFRWCIVTPSIYWPTFLIRTQWHIFLLLHRCLCLYNRFFACMLACVLLFQSLMLMPYERTECGKLLKFQMNA